MLKKIATADLRLGMHLHALDGPWLDHPFWRTKFVLADTADVEAVHASGVTHCWIDAAKGLDVDAPEAPDDAAAERTPTRPAPLADLPEPADMGPPPSTSFEEELAQAARLCK